MVNYKKIKTVRIINDISLMKAVTPHYVTLHIILMKFSDVLIRAEYGLLFHNYLYNEKRFRNTRDKKYK